jgi:hypothetical protein
VLQIIGMTTTSLVGLHKALRPRKHSYEATHKQLPSNLEVLQTFCVYLL